ncbi:MAG TPA: hypothetical protein VER55_04900 [Ardenticatenaceae bacterium]|nr:hypothetical protein [Ardenticatenaceae bacterium]
MSAQDQHLPDGEDGEAEGEPEHDGSRHVGGQAHQDMGPEGQQSAFGRPMSAGEGDDVHDVDNLV